jgi:hypothetical protein
VDARVVEVALSVTESTGLGLARYSMSGTLDEIRTVLARARILPLLVEALDELGPDFLDSDELLEQLAEEAPEQLQPWESEWKWWLIERYFRPYLAE